MLAPKTCWFHALVAVLAAGIGPVVRAQNETEDRVALEKRARDFIERTWALDLRAPGFGDGKPWLNVARPLALESDLAGRVVLIDFWTYCCINCLHVLPDLEYLEKKYHQEAFVVVGCHSAKFANEAEAANVRQAVLRHDIAHPVVVDQDFDIWKRYGVRSWPTLMLVGADGRILAQLSGEGQRETLDVLIAQALAFYRGKEGALAPKLLPWRRETMVELARELSFPGKLSVDPEGRHLYISDSNHHRIVVTTLDGRFVRAFGSGQAGFKDGPALEARFYKPQGLAFQGGALLVADTENHAIRKVDLASGTVSTLAGNGEQGHDREGEFEPLKVSLNSPWDLLVSGDDVIIAMAGPHQIWRLGLKDGKIGNYAGNGRELKADGAFLEGSFAQPSGLAEHEGVVYVADSESSSIRALDLKLKTIRTVVGGNEDPRNLFEFGDEDGKGLGKRLQHPLGVLVHAGVLYVADTYNHKLKVVDPTTNEVKSLVGSGKAGQRDGGFAEAAFFEPCGLAGVGSKLFVADTNNHAIRVVDLEARTVTTLRLVGVPVPMAAATVGRAAPDDAGPLPDLPGTVRHPSVEARLTQGRARLRLKLALPPGAKLAVGAPSQFRLMVREGEAKPERATGPIEGTETLLVVNAAARARLEVQALYYHCLGDTTCSLRSVRWEVTLVPGGEPEAETELIDRPLD